MTKKPFVIKTYKQNFDKEVLIYKKTGLFPTKSDFDKDLKIGNNLTIFYLSEPSNYIFSSEEKDKKHLAIQLTDEQISKINYSFGLEKIIRDMKALYLENVQFEKIDVSKNRFYKLPN